ncbi:MAG: DUF3098 domain-containing protein [Rikenellaceae bacterium]|nr:DUF3098 domain-containing protein [Rikenellaceae bacterium]MDY3894197.1 DUF3098 domain-containing protein [Candidatus Cryptobacteroides sp.]
MANEKKKGMAITSRGLRTLLAGLLVMISGYILMCGGASDDPQVFSYAIFDFRRLVAAPLVILLGLVIEVIAIMGWGIPRQKK